MQIYQNRKKEKSVDINIKKQFINPDLKVFNGIQGVLKVTIHLWTVYLQ